MKSGKERRKYQMKRKKISMAKNNNEYQRRKIVKA